jgi:hypothetical protein
MNELDEINDKFDRLHKLTEEQDILQLSIPKPTESLAISLNIVNHANALILEISKYHGDIEPITKYNYLLEHFEGLCDGVNGMIQDYNITQDETIQKYDCHPKNDVFSTRKKYAEHMSADKVPALIEAQNKMIYHGIRYRGGKLERV